MPVLDFSLREAPELIYKLMLEIWHYDNAVVTEALELRGSGSLNAHGVIRLRFRRTFKPERNLFFCQLRLDSPLQPTGYTGFLIRGAVKQYADGMTTASADHTTWHYNQTRWMNPI